MRCATPGLHRPAYAHTCWLPHSGTKAVLLRKIRTHTVYSGPMLEKMQQFSKGGTISRVWLWGLFPGCTDPQAAMGLTNTIFPYCILHGQQFQLICYTVWDFINWRLEQIKVGKEKVLLHGLGISGWVWKQTHNDKSTGEKHTNLFNVFYVTWATSWGNEDPKKQFTLSIFMLFDEERTAVEEIGQLKSTRLVWPLQGILVRGLFGFSLASPCLRR